MHLSIILAGASIAILAFSGKTENPLSQIYGVVMLPVAVAFIVYSMYQCKRGCLYIVVTAVVAVIALVLSRNYFAIRTTDGPVLPSVSFLTTCMFLLLRLVRMRP
jgi:hypothetical protein